MRLRRFGALILLVSAVADVHGQTEAPVTAAPGPVLVLEGPVPTLGPRIGVQHDFGDGVGWQDGFTKLDTWLPLWQSPGRAVAFTDLRGVVVDDSRIWEANAGIGGRWYSDEWARIFGINSYYDFRDTGKAHFNQLGLGFELLGNRWDLRGNAYFPVGPQHRLVSESAANSGVLTPRFAGHFILLESAASTQLFEAAMRGFDLEVGVPLPVLERFDPRVYAGFYHYETTGGHVANGVRGRATAQLTQRLLVQAEVQNDHVFDTTASVGLLWRFGGEYSRGWPRLGGGRKTLPERLDDPVIRDVHIVVERQTRIGPPAISEPALDPSTGQPLIVQHAEGGAPAGGDGTFEHPYRTLAQVQAGSGPGQILFVRNGTYAGGITLQPGQRLLGDGTPHLFTAQQGTFLLPTVLPGATPTITVADQVIFSVEVTHVAAIVLAPNTEVSGLRIQLGSSRGPSTGIYGARFAGNIDLNHNFISGATDLGVFLTGVTGPLSITQNTITGNATGFESDGVAGRLAFTGNTLRNNVVIGFFADAFVPNPSWTVQNNSFASASFDTFTILTFGGGSACVNLLGNTSPTFVFQRNSGGLQFFASGNNGSIINNGATQVFTPCP
jgi:hypothetical protein